jgi:hypothetical protein
LLIYLAVAGLIGVGAGLTVFFLSNLLNRLLSLDVQDGDVKEDEIADESSTQKVSRLEYSQAQRTVADFREARRRRKEEDDDPNNTLRWLPAGGQTHLVPLLKESRKGSVEERLPLTQETILEVDSSTDLEFD